MSCSMDALFGMFGAMFLKEGKAEQDEAMHSGAHNQREIEASKPSEKENKTSQQRENADPVKRRCMQCGWIWEYINSTDAENKKLQRENKFLKDELNRVKSELQELTDKMAEVYKRYNPGITENSGNTINPSDIANMFQSVYDGAFQRLADNCENEREGLEKLKRILTYTYGYCKNEARLQIHRLVQPEALSVKPITRKENMNNEQNWEDTMLRQCIPDSDCQEIYRLRFEVARSKPVTECVTSQCKKLLLGTFRKEDMVKTFRKSRDKRSDEEDAFITEDLMEYYEQCGKCCWLLATCWPPIQLMFSYKHQPFDAEVRKFFKVIDRDNNTEYCNNSVTQLVWPAVVQILKDKAGFYKQGYVYVNNEHCERPLNDPYGDESAKLSTGNIIRGEPEC